MRSGGDMTHFKHYAEELVKSAFVALVSFFAVVGIALLIQGCSQTVVYKCPAGQVMVLEDGTDERCYTPGVFYHDMRPRTTKRIKKLTQVEE